MISRVTRPTRLPVYFPVQPRLADRCFEFPQTLRRKGLTFGAESIAQVRQRQDGLKGSRPKCGQSGGGLEDLRDAGVQVEIGIQQVVSLGLQPNRDLPVGRHHLGVGYLVHPPT